METVGLSEALDDAGFQEEHCKLERVTESYLLLKKKMSRSHDLIKQYNDKAKECEKLKVDLQKVKEVANKMTTNYNQTLTKLIKVELQNTDFKKQIDTCTRLIAEHETKISADQQHIQQLNCKVKEIEDKHSSKLLDHEMEKLSFQEKIKELISQNKEQKKSNMKESKKGGRKSVEKTKPTEEISTCEVGTNTETVKIATSEKFTMTTNQSIAKATRNMAVNTESNDKVFVDREIMTEISYKLQDKDIYPLYCEKCEQHLDPMPLTKICEIMSSCPPMITEVPPSPVVPRKAVPRIIVTEANVTPDTSTSSIQSMEKRLEMLELKLKKKLKKMKKPSKPTPSTPPSSSCCHHNSSFPIDLIPKMFWETLLQSKSSQPSQKSPSKSPLKSRKRKSNNKKYGKVKRFKANRSERQKDSGNWSVEFDTSAALEQSFMNSTSCEEGTEENEKDCQKDVNMDFEEDQETSNEEIEEESFSCYEEKGLKKVDSSNDKKIEISKLKKKIEKNSVHKICLDLKPKMKDEDSAGRSIDISEISKKGTENTKIQNKEHENLPENVEFITDRRSSLRSRKSSNSKIDEVLPKTIDSEEENKKVSSKVAEEVSKTGMNLRKRRVSGNSKSQDAIRDSVEEKAQVPKLNISLRTRKPSIAITEELNDKIVDTFENETSSTPDYVEKSSEFIQNREEENVEVPGMDSYELQRSSEESGTDSPQRQEFVSSKSDDRNLDLTDSSHEGEKSVLSLKEGAVVEKDENLLTTETDLNDIQKSSVRKRRVINVQSGEATSKTVAKNSSSAVCRRKNSDVTDFTSDRHHLQFDKKELEGNPEEREGNETIPIFTKKCLPKPLEEIDKESNEKEMEECDLKIQSTEDEVQTVEKNQERIRTVTSNLMGPKPIVIPPERTVLLKKLRRLKNQSKKMGNTATLIALKNVSSDNNEKCEIPVKKHRIAHSVKDQNNLEEKVQFPQLADDSWKDFNDPNSASELNNVVNEIVTKVSPEKTFKRSISLQRTRNSKKKSEKQLNSKDDTIDSCDISSSSILEYSHKTLDVSGEMEDGELSETEETENDSLENFDKNDTNSTSEKIRNQENLEAYFDTPEKLQKIKMENKNNSIENHVEAVLPKKIGKKMVQENLESSKNINPYEVPKTLKVSTKRSLQFVSANSNDSVEDSKTPGKSVNILEEFLDSPASPKNIEDRIPKSLEAVGKVSNLSGPSKTANILQNSTKTLEDTSQEILESPASPENIEDRLPHILNVPQYSESPMSPENSERLISENLETPESPEKSETPRKSQNLERIMKFQTLSSPERRNQKNIKDSESEFESDLMESPAKSEKSWKRQNSQRNDKLPGTTETSESEKELDLSRGLENQRVFRGFVRSSESEKETDSMESPGVSQNSKFPDNHLENLGKGEKRFRRKRKPVESQQTSVDSPEKNCFESQKPLRRVTRRSDCQESPRSPENSTRSLIERKTSPRIAKQPERNKNIMKSLNGSEQLVKLGKKSTSSKKRNSSMKESESEIEEGEEEDEEEGEEGEKDEEEEEKPIKELRSRSILDSTRKMLSPLKTSPLKNKKTDTEKSKDPINKFILPERTLKVSVTKIEDEGSKEETLTPENSSTSSASTLSSIALTVTSPTFSYTPGISRHVPVIPVRELRSRKIQIVVKSSCESAKGEAKENDKRNLESSQKRMTRNQELVELVVEENGDQPVVISDNSVLENLSKRKQGNSVALVEPLSSPEGKSGEESGKSRKRRSITPRYCKKPVKESSKASEAESETKSLDGSPNKKVEVPVKAENEQEEGPKGNERELEGSDVLENSMEVEESMDEDMNLKEEPEQNFQDYNYLEIMVDEELMEKDFEVDEKLEKNNQEKSKEESENEEGSKKKGFEKKEKDIEKLIKELEERFDKSNEGNAEKGNPINERKKGVKKFQGTKNRKFGKGFEKNHKVVKRKKEVKLDEDGNPIPEILSPLDLLEEHMMNKTISEEKIIPKNKQKAINEIVVKKDRFIEHQLYILISNTKWESEAHSKIVEMVSSVSHRFLAMSVINFMVKKAGTDRTLDKTYTPPAPLLTAAQQKILAFLMDLEKKAPILNHVLAGIEYKLFRLNASPDVRVVEYLTRMMAAILRIKKDRSKLRIFLCDALYCLGVKAMPLIYVILTCWPEAFPTCGHTEDLLPKSIVQFVLLQKVESQDFKASAVKRLFMDLYQYPACGYRPETLCNELLTAFQEKHDYRLHTAILLLAKREGTDWTHRHIVKGKLLPMIVRSQQSSDYHAFHLLGNILRSYSVDDSEGIVGDIIDQLCDLLDSGEGSEDRQEGVASALLSLSRHQFKKCLTAVLKWKPTKDLRDITREQLHATFEAKNYHVLNVLKWNLSKSESVS